MLKWLQHQQDPGGGGSGGTAGGWGTARDTAHVTDDPLATLGVHKNQLYAVSRVNPLFVDDNYNVVLPPAATVCTQPSGGSGVPSGRGVSSGRTISSSGYGSCGEPPLPAPPNVPPHASPPPPPPVWPASLGGPDALRPSEDLYIAPSSSSGFSEPGFAHNDWSTLTNGVRNVILFSGDNLSPMKTSPTTVACGMISTSEQNYNKGQKPEYHLGGKLCRSLAGTRQFGAANRGPLLRHDDKPSVWEMYYGAGAAVGDVTMKARPTDPQPNYVGGRVGWRPEADFTLDVTKSELLAQRLRRAKRRRCGCRALAAVLGLVLFLLAVCAVSLILTRGQRVFGSML